MQVLLSAPRGYLSPGEILGTAAGVRSISCGQGTAPPALRGERAVPARTGRAGAASAALRAPGNSCELFLTLGQQLSTLRAEKPTF